MLKASKRFRGGYGKCEWSLMGRAGGMEGGGLMKSFWIERLRVVKHLNDAGKKSTQFFQQ